VEDSGAEGRGDEPLVVFVHIRKTAGKTLRQVLYRQYRRRNTKLVRNYFTDASSSFVAVSDLAANPRDLQALHGHMLFWPELPWPEATRFVTILRDPVERTLSHYYWLCARSRRYTKSLEEAISDGSIHDNLQTRVISGEMPDYMGLGEDALAKAIERLDLFAVVGVTERFDESLALMTQTLGWQWKVYSRENVTPGRKPRSEIAPETIARIEEINQLDAVLYRRATERFEADLARQDDGFRADLEALRLASAQAADIAEGSPFDVPVARKGDDLRSRLVAARTEVLLRDAEIERLRVESKETKRRDRDETRPPRTELIDPTVKIDRALETAQGRLRQVETRIRALEENGEPDAAALDTLRRKADASRMRIAGLEQRRAAAQKRTKPEPPSLGG
jgi:hypothetical protein